MLAATSSGEAARPAWTHAACADVECGGTDGGCAEHPARASTCDVEMVDADEATTNVFIADAMNTFAAMAEILRELHGAKIEKSAKQRQAPKKSTPSSLPEDLDIIKETWERAAGIENKAPSHPTPAEASERARLSKRRRDRRNALKQSASYLLPPTSCLLPPTCYLPTSYLLPP